MNLKTVIKRICIMVFPLLGAHLIGLKSGFFPKMWEFLGHEVKNIILFDIILKRTRPD